MGLQSGDCSALGESQRAGARWSQVIARSVHGGMRSSEGASRGPLSRAALIRTPFLEVTSGTQQSLNHCSGIHYPEGEMLLTKSSHSKKLI